MGATFGWGRIPEAELYNDAVKALKEHAKILNSHLQGRTWLVGAHINVADIVVAGAF